MAAETNNLTLLLKKKYPMLQNFTDRTFGVEIEFFGLDYLITPVDNNIIKPYLISSRAKDGRHLTDICQDYKLSLGTNRDTWHFEQDTSVRGKGHTKFGAELISPILSGIEGLVQVYNAFRFLNDVQGIDIDKTCGFHVHHGVDRKIFECKQLQQLVRVVYLYEDLFYLLIPGERRNAETCRPMEIDVNAFLQLCDGHSETDCRIKKLWYSPENRFDSESAKSPRYDKTRYHGLNLHSYWYRSTIEFRYYSSLLREIDEAMQWIIFTQFLIELSQGNIPDIYKQSETNKWLNTIYKIYFALGYQDRIKTA